MSDRLRKLSDEAARIIAGFGDAIPGTEELREGMHHLPQTAAADPAVALVRVRKALQFVVAAAYERQFKEPAGTRPLENLVQRLVKEGDLPRRLAAYGNLVRDLGNIGAHSFEEAVALADVEQALEQVLPLLRWHGAHAAPAPHPAPTVRPDAGPQTPKQDRRRGRGWGWTAVGVSSALVLGLVIWLTIRSFTGGTPSAQPAVGQDSKESAAVHVPSRVGRLPAGAVLQLIYEGEPPSGQAQGSVSLRLEVRFRKGRRGDWQSLADGAKLSSADEYRLVASPSVARYLYVFQVDSLGKLTTLYPALAGARYSSGSNPLPAGQEVHVPADSALHLDENLGPEHVYAILATAPWVDLEKALLAAEAAPGAGESVTEPFQLALRGVGGTVPLSGEATATGKESPVERRAQEFSGFGLSLLVVERWFVHIAPDR
jgi:hypothetical protein